VYYNDINNTKYVTIKAHRLWTEVQMAMSGFLARHCGLQCRLPT